MPSDGNTPPAGGTPPADPPKDDPAPPVVTDKEGVTISLEEFKAMQLDLAKAKKENKTLNEEKADIKKNAVLAELTLVNKKLAELNKDKDEATLTTILATVKAMKGEFPEHNPGGKPKEDELNRQDYDFVKGEWLFT